MTHNHTTWENDWFGSPYYHILYRDRNEAEAAHFMDNLTRFLQLEKGNSLLDLACGRGRHARYLNRIGYKVTALDLSEYNIRYARRYENPTLRFEKHDMRVPYPQTFDAVLNLFTSFGYFERESDNLDTIGSIMASLKPNGYGVIDFMNACQAIENLKSSEVKKIEGIEFRIERRYKRGFILKDVYFEADNRYWHFTEKVNALTKTDFEDYLKQAGANLKHCFGNYDLEPYDRDRSNRLILIFKR